jgi:hypothetical protein
MLNKPVFLSPKQHRKLRELNQKYNSDPTKSSWAISHVNSAYIITSTMMMQTVSEMLVFDYILMCLIT